MRTLRTITRGLAGILIAMLLIPPGLPAQDYGETEQNERFSKQELTQMLAPIALYPDSLTADILMASTYPLEIVEAERWLRNNSGLKGDALDDALQNEPWDPSVKSLCHFPEVLFAMSDKLDQTRKLGDAFLSQEDDVMATIQELRRRAEDQGNLVSNEKQKVVVEPEAIMIEPAGPDVVYVPVYDPFYVYGPWWYPDYPPYYWYYPPGLVISGGYISFGPPVFIGFGLFSWAWFDWHVHRIHIDAHKTRRFQRFDRHTPGSDQHFWRHSPGHRRGVAYRDRRTSERFGRRKMHVSPAGPETRGYLSGRFERRATEPSGGTFGRGRGVSPRMRTDRGKTTIRRDTPFRGIGEGNFERRAGQRGGESRRSIGTYQGGSVRHRDGQIRSPGGSVNRGGNGRRGGFRR